MDKIYAFLFTVIVAAGFTNASAQISIDPNPIYLDIPDPTVNEKVAYSLITNEAEVTKEFKWYKEEIELTSEWDCAICDINQCYLPSTFTEEFTLEAGQSGAMDVHIYPNDVDGGAIIRVLVEEVGNTDNSVEGFYYFNQSVSVPEHLTEAIAIYPNPADDFVRIENGVDVNNIEVYNLAGKMVRQVNVNNTKTIDVSDLGTGTYVARLFNKDGAQVSSNVLIKK